MEAGTHPYCRFMDCHAAGEYLAYAKVADGLFRDFKAECDGHERRVLGLTGMRGG